MMEGKNAYCFNFPFQIPQGVKKLNLKKLNKFTNLKLILKFTRFHPSFPYILCLLFYLQDLVFRLIQASLNDEIHTLINRKEIFRVNGNVMQMNTRTRENVNDLFMFDKFFHSFLLTSTNDFNKPSDTTKM